TARGVLELAAVVPAQVERWVLEAAMSAAVSGLEECLAVGMLHLKGDTVAFRHELARQAIEGALSPARQRALHAQALRALLEREEGRIQLARLAHHAALAEDGALVLQYAPAAARQAAARGAHREAAAQYQTALDYATRLAAEQQSKLLE